MLNKKRVSGFYSLCRYGQVPSLASCGLLQMAMTVASMPQEPEPAGLVMTCSPRKGKEQECPLVMIVYSW